MVRALCSGGCGAQLGLALVEPSGLRLAAASLVALALALDIGATLAFQLTVALGKTVWWSFRYPLQNLLLVTGTVTLYELASVEGALAAIAVASGIALLAGAAVVARPIRSAPRGKEVSRDMSRFLRLQGASSVLVLLTHRGGVVAVALLVGSQVETGYAALAIGISIALFYVALQICAVSLPRLSALGADGSDRADSALRRLAWTTLAVLARSASLCPHLPTRCSRGSSERSSQAPTLRSPSGWRWPPLPR